VIALLQRVTAARVEVVVPGRVADETTVVGAIERGLLALIGVERGDDERAAERLIERVLAYRMFSDADGKMNLSLAETGGGLLLVPQFTLAADTDKGLRPSFTPAAAPAEGQRLFERALGLARARHPQVASGRFGASMQVHLVNDGPVTFWLQAAPAAAAGRQ
jgi:D-tyrosyl-tRNA(Tyr) deacylase